ncbi:MAG: tyrosine-type recombinase/integrase [Anaerolineaceae bacterium]
MKNFTLYQMIDGYMLYAESILSPHTIADYSNTFKKLTTYLGDDLPACDIDTSMIEGFMAAQKGLKKKTLLNYHTGLSALWQWGVARSIVPQNTIRLITPPKPEVTDIQPFTAEDIRLILASLNKTKPYYSIGRREVMNTLHFVDRYRAMILLLLDTGIRVSEFCDLKIKDVDLRNRNIFVMGKGSKERTIPFSPRTGQTLWRYLTTKPDQTLYQPAFSTDDGLRLDRANVLRQCQRIGARAGVQDCHPHRFRHTFAIQYLRNGGDIYTLQKILGHSTLDMVKRYLMIAQTDLEAAHRIASPVTRWGL